MIPEYFQEDTTKNPLELLERIYSKSEIKRLTKQGGILVARKDTGDLWIKVGKEIFVFVKTWNFLSQQAQVWWEYHYQLMPKVLKWEKIK